MAIYPELNILSLCSGYSGIELGLGLVQNVRTVVYVEREAFAAANLAAKMEQGFLAPAPIWSDLVTFDGKPWRGIVDIITGGIPCQPFSCAGKKKRLEDERWIWGDVYRIIQEVRPEYAFIEEVRGFIQHGLPVVLSDLAAIGYDAEWDLFRAPNVGLPHKRERLFILAYTGLQRPEEREIEPESPEQCREGLADNPHAQTEAEIFGRNSLSGGIIPARPGEPQHEWEPPRTTYLWHRTHNRHGELADHKYLRELQQKGCEQDERRRTSNQSPSNRKTKSGTRNTGETESALGRNTDGRSDWMVRSTSRMDELRLLGNGVVPPVAAVAWIVLNERMRG